MLDLQGDRSYHDPHIHSKYLVHWTVKKEDLGGRNKEDVYVERLRDICTVGLKMFPGTESIHGRHEANFKATISKVCFSENKLSEARSHSKHFGKLGIGVNRKFVLERQGNPVFYMQNGRYSAVAQCLAELQDALAANPALKIANTPALKILEVVLGFSKDMSRKNSYDLKFYDEMEWRIVHLDHLVPDYITIIDAPKRIYALKLKASDIELLVFPSMSIARKAFDDTHIAKFFKNSMPMITAVSAMKNF